VASLAFSGGIKAATTVTALMSGASNATAYVASITTPAGHTQTARFTTDGSGAGSFTFVPSSAGTYAVSVVPATATATVTAKVNIGGHN
jgi:hypothetical protein